MAHGTDTSRHRLTLVIDCGNQDEALANVCRHVIMQPNKEPKFSGIILCGVGINMSDSSSRVLLCWS